MSPPIVTFQTSEIPTSAQTGLNGKKRKGFDGNLKGCELLEMVQYDCRIDGPVRRNSVVRCWPVERLFRRCKDRDGDFMVETTSWEGTTSGK